MSDPQSYGDPVDEPKDEAHDVVGRAHEGLADAEAAQRDAVDPAEAAAAWDERERDQHVSSTPAATETTTATVHDASPVAPTTTTDLDDEDARWAAYAASAEPEAAPAAAATEAATTDASTQRYDAYGDTAGAAAAGGAVAAGAAAAGASSTPVASTTAYDTRSTDAPTTASPTAYANTAQPIFVQAPEAPRPRGNRGAAGAIGLLAALCFAVLYLAATLGLRLLTGDLEVSGLANAALGALATWGLWVPTVAFYLGFWFLGALINRGRWGHWVVWGLVVGVIAWGGHLLGALFAAPFWMLTAREGVDLLGDNVLAPLAIVAFVLGRELTIWFGAWVARRGRRVTELNDEAQREYERTLEAGPQVSVV
ncbi:MULTISPECIES: ABC transporter [Microbacterium]|uniref:ABC transporter n=1 Tax=Microbacterium TaxID=33882 RepID=UPI0027839859|nr:MULTISPECIES: ABC transporter [Microbacterium]MDQ1074410.1 hypothetical protein [Microbacterium sp. SORGH_AS_0969]MDQ1114640.1 hypothetical protein [Microbacterium testaceum]